MHLSRVFYVFLNTSNKLRDNVVISIVNNLYLISIYIYIYTRFLHVESIFWSDGICILRPFCCWRPRIHRKTIVFPDIRSRWQIYWSPLFRTRTQLYQSYKLLDLLAKNFTVCSWIVRTANRWNEINHSCQYFTANNIRIKSLLRKRKKKKKENVSIKTRNNFY